MKNTFLIGGRFKAPTPGGQGRLAAGVAGLMMLASLSALAQATVTTLTDAHNGTPGYTDGRTFSQAQFRAPAGLALDPSGNTLFLADSNNNAVRMVTFLGNNASSYTSSAYTNAQGINHPIAVAVDNATNVYVLNRGSGANGTLLKFNGGAWINYSLQILLSTNAAQLTNATALALDYYGNQFVTVKSNTVIRISATNSGVATVVGVITNAGTSLQGIVVMDNGRLALSDAGNHGIWMMDPANSSLSNNAVKFTGFHGAADVLGPPAYAAFNRPENLSKAGNGVLVVADFNNAKIKIIDTNGAVTRLYGINPSRWSGSYPGWSEGTVNPTESLDTVQARQPYGVVVARDGTVYVTETYYCLLRQATGTGLPPLPPPPPPAPTIWTVTTNFGQVTLTWSPIAAATSYNIKRAAAPNTNGPFTLIANVSATTYKDSTVVNGATYYYVVSAVNNGSESQDSSAVRATVPLPPVADPQIGIITILANTNTSPVTYSSLFTAISPSSADLYNDAILGIKGTPNTGTYYTTDGSTPTTNSSSVASDYQDGIISNPSQILKYTVSAVAPSLVVKAVGAKSDGSPNSAVVQANFNFKTGSPSVIGNNAALFTINDITSGAQFAYTTDGSDPTTNINAIVIGPASSPSGITLSLQFPANSNSMVFQIVAFKPNYQTSPVVSTVFSTTNFVANTITFGFGSGEASSVFLASPGQTFYAPVTLNALPNTTIYSLQFNVTVTNVGAATIVRPGAFSFQSMLVKPIPNSTPPLFSRIPPQMFVGGAGFTNLMFTNVIENLLGVGWLERAGKTNLYDTTKQNLITYSLAHDDLFPNSTQPNGVILGGYAFQIPTSATIGDQYKIQIGRPSATDDGIGAPGSSVFIAAPTNGAIAAGLPVNALKFVTVTGQIKYLAGSVYPFRWFNAGDFGSTNIIAPDVEQVFQSAVYFLNTPPPGSDFFDAMDSCGNYGYLDGDPSDVNNGNYTNALAYPYQLSYTATNYTIYVDTNGIQSAPVPTSLNTNVVIVLLTSDHYTATYYNTYIQQQPTTPATYTTNVVAASYSVLVTPGAGNLFDGNDTDINQIAFGDGVLDVCDVYVTYRRSLDSSLTWFRRFWNNGQLVADTGAPNVASHVVAKGQASGSVQPKLSAPSPVPPQVDFSAGDITNCSAGQVVQIPINATIHGSYPLRALMLNLTVAPLDGSPALTKAVEFQQTATVIGAPYTTDSSGAGNYSSVWLDTTNAGLTGTVTLGTLTVTIPAGAPANAAYAVHFDHASASPNGLASFAKQTLTGLITLSSRTNSSYGDGIPDSWRLRWFGTVNNILSTSNACPSGDGINNWQKFVAGVDPSTANNFPTTKPVKPSSNGAAMGIHWPSVSGKQYVIERSGSLFPGTWSNIATNTGTGTDMEFDDTSAAAVNYYRVRILP